MKLTVACLCLLVAVALAKPYYKNTDRINQAGCGVSKTQSRIVGGTTAEKGQYPWIASLRVPDSSRPGQWRHTCGCSIINDEFMLVAGHCFGRNNNYDPKNYRVRIGTYNQTAGDSEVEATEFEVEKIIRHDRYSQGIVIQNDIAMMKLKGKINFNNDYVNAVCLPETPVATDEKVVTVAGWGDLKTSPFVVNIPDLLQQTDLIAKPDAWCKERWGFSFSDVQMICAIDETTSPCNGDSGGPLTFQDETDGHHIQVGVVSFGESSCKGPRPPVFTRVSDYIDWIKSGIEKN